MARMEALLAERVAAQGDVCALSDGFGTRWSYAELSAASDALADTLQGAGVVRNDRVMLLSENCASLVAGLFAAWKLGAVIIPTNARQTPSEVARVLEHATPAAVLITSEVSREAAAHAEALGATEITGSFGTMHVRAGRSNPDVELHDVATLLYTTGTTGTPKGVMLTHAAMRFGGAVSAKLRGMGPGDVVYGALPIAHVFGLVPVVTGAVHAGSAVRLEARFTAAGLYQALMEDVTVLPGVPQMHALMMQYIKEQGLGTLDAPGLRFVSSGGAPLDPAWKRKAEAFYGLPLQNGYGMTETTGGASATANTIGSPDISAGPKTPGTEMRIRGSGEEGELLVRGPHIMKGYYRNPQETAKALDADGWLSTGDLAKIDAAGNLHILGRSKELIIHGGFNVYPPEVEAAINDHPAVIQSAVVGDMIDGDEKVLAFVELAAEGDVTEADLRLFVAERLSGYKRPSRYVFALKLPAAPTGKILKHKLKAFFAKELG